VEKEEAATVSILITNMYVPGLDLPNVSQSPTSVRQLPTRWTLFSGELATRGYQLPTSSTYWSTHWGFTSWNSIECTYLPRASTWLKLASI
jgi:hypothetical protein